MDYIHMYAAGKYAIFYISNNIVMQLYVFITIGILCPHCWRKKKKIKRSIQFPISATFSIDIEQLFLMCYICRSLITKKEKINRTFKMNNAAFQSNFSSNTTNLLTRFDSVISGFQRCGILDQIQNSVCWFTFLSN